MESVVAIVPALNEAKVIGTVVRDLLALRRHGQALIAQVVVCDNGSGDGTGEVAHAAGATVVCEAQRGYGAACLAALAHIERSGLAPHIVLFVDGDGSLDAQEAEPLISAIESGADLAMGARPSRWVEDGAMTPPQRFGTRLAVVLIAWFFAHRFEDLGPFRAISRSALRRIDMTDRAYGWTVEMQVKALCAGLTIVELPVHTRRRVGQSKISGTVRGVVGAGVGIIGMIVRLRLHTWRHSLRRWRLRTQ